MRWICHLVKKTGKSAYSVLSNLLTNVITGMLKSNTIYFRQICAYCSHL